MNEGSEKGGRGKGGEEGEGYIRWSIQGSYRDHSSFTIDLQNGNNE